MKTGEKKKKLKRVSSFSQNKKKRKNGILEGQSGSGWGQWNGCMRIWQRARERLEMVGAA